MSTHLIQSETLTGIANAIRSKDGTSAAITVSDMASKIGGLEPYLNETVLWENPDPSAEFTAQDVALSDAAVSMDYFGMFYRASSSIDAYYYPVFSAVTEEQFLSYLRKDASPYVFIRPFVFSSDKRVVTFSGGHTVAYYNSRLYLGTNNSYIIPTHIVGFKRSIRGV